MHLPNPAMLYYPSAPVCSVLHRTLLRTPLGVGVAAKRKTAQTTLWQVLRRLRTAQRPGGAGMVEEPHPITAVDEGTFDITQADVVSLVIPCLPLKCRPLVTAVTEAILEPMSDVMIPPKTLREIVPLLEGLTPMFSIVAMVPLSVVPALEQAVLHPDSFLSDHLLLAETKEYAPEVLKALKTCYSHGALLPSLLAFVEGLLDRLATWVDCGIAPPPFDPIPDSYNPELTGIAFRLTRSGLRGRVVRRYVSDTTEEAKLRAEQCQKQFPTTQFRTGGLFR